MAGHVVQCYAGAMRVTHAYSVAPSPKVRMSRKDVWLQPPRPIVAKWRAFKDAVREAGIKLRNGDTITFVVPMPDSWSKSKRAKMCGTPHQQTPDLDNLLGGLMDAAHPEGDKQFHEFAIRKIWGEDGAIFIER